MSHNNTSSLQAKRAALESILIQAAEIAGDITQPVLQRFYVRYPEAKAAFERLAGVDTPHVEARMIENCLYCIMEWWGRPGEISGLLEDSIPHHIRTLEVGTDWYWGLREALDVIEETIPEERTEDRALWGELSRGLHREIEFAAGG